MENFETTLALPHCVLFLSNTANFSKFNLPYMKWFHEQRWQVDYCSAGEEPVAECDRQFSIPIARSPFSLSNIAAYGFHFYKGVPFIFKIISHIKKGVHL